MAKADDGFVVGELLAVPKIFKDKNTGETRKYTSYEVHFPGIYADEEDIVVRFSVRAEDRSLFEHLLRGM